MTETDGAYHAAPNGTACSVRSAAGVCNGGLCGSCGNGRLESGEDCDDGAENLDEPNHCSTHCELSVCGDKIVTAGAESCDDGNANSNDACANCRAISWSSALAFGLGPNNGATTRRAINAVTGMAAANDGSIYITQNAPAVSVDRATFQQGFVLRVSQSSQTLLRIAGTEHQLTGHRAETSIARETSLQALNGIAVDPRGTIYVSEFEDASIEPYIHSIDTQGILRIVAGNGRLCSASSVCPAGACDPEPCGDGGFARAASLRGPSALAFDQTGDLYFVDGNTVRVIDADGYISTIAGNGTLCADRADCVYPPNASPKTVSLGLVKGIAFSAGNELLLGIRYDGTNDAIDIVRNGIIEHQLNDVKSLGPLVGTLDGTVIFSADSSNGTLFSYDAGQKRAVPVLTSTKDTEIPALSVAADRSVVFVDSTGRAVRRVVNDVVSDVFVSPPEAAVFTGVLATSTPFEGTGGAFADNGDLYVSTSTGIYIRHASSGILDAVPSNVPFTGVSDLAWDGRLFVADQVARKVYALVDGTATVIAGNGGPEPSTAAANANATTLALEPSGLDVRNGVLTMTTRYAVWQVDLTSGAATRVLGTSFGNPLRCPNDAVTDSTGDVYIADTQNCRIVRVHNGAASDYVTSASCGVAVDPGSTAQCSLGLLDKFTPANLALTGTTLYFSDQGSAVFSAVRSVTTGAGAAVDFAAATVIAGAQDAFGQIDNDLALSTALELPRVLLGRDGSLYVMQLSTPAPAARAVMRLTADARLITVVGNADGNLTGPFAVAATGSPAQAARIDASTIVIADAESGGLLRVDLANEIVDVVYGNTAGNGISTESRYAAFFGRASAVAYDSTKQLVYLGGNEGLYRIETAGSRDPATWIYNLQDGATIDALAYDTSADALFLCDAAHHSVERRVLRLGQKAIVAGRFGFVGYSGDGGPASAALLDTPLDIVLSSKGSFYIADSGNQRVRRVDANGIITTVIGNGIAATSPDDSTLPAALHTINQPQGLVFDVFGNLVIAGRGAVSVVLADGESGEPDGSSHVTTIFRSDAQNQDLAQCLKTLFNGKTDAEIYAGDACSGAVFRLTRQAAP